VVRGDPIDHLERQVVTLGDLGADGRVRALDLVVDRLADVVQEAAHLGDLHVRADLRGDDRGEIARLDRMAEHVLAVARAVLEPAEQLDDLRRQARDARLVGGRLAGLAHDDLDLGPGLGDDLLDATGVDAAVGDELGQGDPSNLAPDGVETGQDHGLGRVVDDQVDARRLLEGSDVAALAADDPPLHLVRWQVDDGNGVLGRMVGGHALHRGEHDVASLVLGLLARGALDRTTELDGVVLGLGANRLEQHRLGVLRGQPRHALQGDDLLRDRAGEVLLGLLEFAVAIEELAVASLEHLGALVELLVTLYEAAFLRGQLAAPRPGLFLGLATEAELFVLRLEDELLLAGAGFGLDATGLRLGRLHPLRCPHAAGECAEYGSADGGHEGHRHEGERVHRLSSHPDRIVRPDASQVRRHDPGSGGGRTQS
jgi:hypothetical protein